MKVVKLGGHYTVNLFEAEKVNGHALRSMCCSALLRIPSRVTRRYHPDRDGTGRRLRSAGNAQGRRLHHRAEQGVLRGLRHADGRTEYRRSRDSSRMRIHPERVGKLFKQTVNDYGIVIDQIKTHEAADWRQLPRANLFSAIPLCIPYSPFYKSGPHI